jgi:hypothetical protein
VSGELHARDTTVLPMAPPPQRISSARNAVKTRSTGAIDRAIASALTAGETFRSPWPGYCTLPQAFALERFAPTQENEMGKYLLAWLLGVPAGLLVLVYLFTHL